MTTIAFLGLGNMGGPMAANLVTSGYAVHGFDLVPRVDAGRGGARAPRSSAPGPKQSPTPTW